MTIYGVGFLSVFALLGLMYRHAWRWRAQIGLTPLEALEARISMRTCWIHVDVALVSITLAQLEIGMVIGLPGWIYAATGPLAWWHGARAEKSRKALAG